ncbi:MAG: hypothetical protein ACJ76X_11725 [Solirubrobacteraceae bacterium]|jgi:hypothetical protein
MEPSVILSVWQSGDTGRLADGLAEGVTFSSPVTDYRGREDAVHILGLIASAIDDVHTTAAWEAERETVWALTGKANGHDLQGMLRECHDVTGRVVHATLYLRPYRALNKAMERMGELLSASPLPSRATPSGPD